VEIPLPNEAARRALLGLYARDLPVTPAALDDAAGRCGGVTASFFKELARRTVLTAADAERPVDDRVLADVVTEMLSDTEQLTRALLGGSAGNDNPQSPPAAGEWQMYPGQGWPRERCRRSGWPVAR
jgi:hypothetical protein